MDRAFLFTVDDNIRFLKELTEGDYASIFDHPYPAMYRRLHERYGLKVQLNLFYELLPFDLSMMTDRYRKEWEENADWLKLSFHSRIENVKPYRDAGYDEVDRDVSAVHREIDRFASPAARARTTTVHYCLTTEEGYRALRDHGVEGLLGLYGTEEAPRTSYTLSTAEGDRIRRGEMVLHDGIAVAGIDVILNLYDTETILARLAGLSGRPRIRVMIHEQYFYPDYPKYQPEFEDKLSETFRYLTENGYRSALMEEDL